MSELPVKCILHHAGVCELVTSLASRLFNSYMGRRPGSNCPPWTDPDIINIYPIPRGGVPVAYLLAGVVHEKRPRFVIVDDPARADCFVDDLIDSGSTAAQWLHDYPTKPFFALIDKRVPDHNGNPWGWVVFPWESAERSEDNTIVGTLTNRIKDAGASFRANESVSPFIYNEQERNDLQSEVAKRSQALLDALLIDTRNDHNTDGTAGRMAKMFIRETCAGRYNAPPKITTFPNAAKLDEMLISGPISIRSLCSHHFCPILGRAWIGMVPGERVAGLSKFNRIVDWFANRPQIQEELVVQIADYLEAQLKPKGLAVVIEASHTCMTWRGVRESNEAVMTTNVMRGVFKDHATTRAEFFSMLKK